MSNTADSLRLIIDGDPSGGKRALEEIRQGMGAVQTGTLSATSAQTNFFNALGRGNPNVQTTQNFMAALGRETATASNNAVAAIQKYGLFTGTLTNVGQRLGLTEGAASMLSMSLVRLAGPAALGMAIRQGIDYAGTVDKMSAATGTSVRGIQELENVAVGSSVSLGAMTSGVNDLQKRVADGDQSAVGALKKLGIEINAFQRMQPQEQFFAVARALKQVQGDGEKAALAAALFRNWKEVMPALKSDVDDLRDSVHILSERQVKDLAKVQQEWDQLVLAGKRYATMLVSGIFDPSKWLDIPIISVWKQILQQKPPTDQELADLVRPFTDRLDARAVADAWIKSKQGKGPTQPGMYEAQQALEQYETQRKKQEEAVKKAQAEAQRITQEGIDRDLAMRAEAWKARYQLLDRQGLQEIERLAQQWKEEQAGIENNLRIQRELESASARERARMLDFNGVRAMDAAAARYQKEIEDAKKFGQDFGKAMGASIGNIPQHLINAFTGGGGTKGAMKAIAVDLSSTLMGSLFGSGKNADGTPGSGLLKNVDMGSMIGGIVGKAIPVIGPLIGLAVQGLIKAFGDHTGKDMKRTGKEWGVELSAGLLDQLKTDHKKYGGEMQAMLMNLDKIIGEAGGVKQFGVDKAIEKTRDLFVMVETGALKAQDAGLSFNKVFAQLLPESIDKTTGLAKASFLELIALARASGVESDAVNQFLKTQAQGIADGLNAVAAGTVGHWNRAREALTATGQDLITARENVDKLQAQIDDMTKRGGPATESQRVQMATWIRQLADAKQSVLDLTRQQTKATAAITEAGTAGQASYDRLGRMASVTFEAMIASGASLQDTLAAIGPTLDDLAAAQQTFGFTTSDTVGELLKLRQFTNQNQELIGTLDGVNKMMAGLHNMGLLSQDAFNDLTRTANDTFKKMVDGGLSSRQAMALMQPTLQTIWDLQRKHGLAVDETTQKMIDQGVEAGIIGEQHRNAQERMAESMGRVVDVLEAMATKMGVMLPAAAKKAGDSAVQQFHRVEEAADKAGDAVDGLTFGHSPGGIKEIPLQLVKAGHATTAFGRDFAGVMREAEKGCDAVVKKVKGLKPPDWAKGKAKDEWVDLAREIEIMNAATEFEKDKLRLQFEKQDEIASLRERTKELGGKDVVDKLVGMVDQLFDKRLDDLRKTHASDLKEAREKAADEKRRDEERAAEDLAKEKERQTADAKRIADERRQADRELALLRAPSEFDRDRLSLQYKQEDELEDAREALGSAFTALDEAKIVQKFRLLLEQLEAKEAERRAKEREKAANEIPGAANGVFATGLHPELYAFGEAGEPELGGPVRFMSKALAGALQLQRINASLDRMQSVPFDVAGGRFMSDRASDLLSGGGESGGRALVAAVETMSRKLDALGQVTLNVQLPTGEFRRFVIDTTKGGLANREITVPTGALVERSI